MASNNYKCEKHRVQGPAVKKCTACGKIQCSKCRKEMKSVGANKCAFCGKLNTLES